MDKKIYTFFQKYSTFVGMLHKTRAIVLHCVNYSDTYRIVSVFTETFGPVSYLTARSKGKVTRVPKSLFHPLSILDLEVEHQNLRDIQRIKEAKVHVSLPSVLSNPVKSTISIFLAEWLEKALKAKQPDTFLFDYLLQSIQVLDLLETNYADFHLNFLIRLSQFLGICPDNRSYRQGMFFDLQNGVFTSQPPQHSHFLNIEESRILSKLLRMTYANRTAFHFSGRDRRAILLRILEYYRIHLAPFPEIQSLDVLHEVFG